jgi:hypothetical protein
MRAELPQVRVHDLKHTFGRRLRAAGVSFDDRQGLIGHRSARITGLRYLPRLANAAAVLQKPFTGQELLGALACATPEPDDRGAVAMSPFRKSSQRPVPGVRWQSF